jgi:hypothetical protein
MNKNQRINNLYKITNKKAELISFKLNKAQQDFLSKRDKRNIILKSRQLGFSTFAAVDSLDSILFTPNIEALIISYDDDSSNKIFEKVALAWEHFKLPDFDLKSLYTIDSDKANKLKIGFGDGTYSSIAVKSTGRGTTTNKLHVSELAKICAKYPSKADEMLTGSIQSVPPSGEVTIESTAEGSTGLFHSMFWKAWNRPTNAPIRPGEYKAFFYNWQWDEDIKDIKEPDAQIPKEFLEYQAKHNAKCVDHPDKYMPIDDIQITYWFYKWLGVNSDWEKLLQEYPTTPEEAFRGSGEALFDRNIVQKYKDRAKQPIKIIGDWKIYEEGKPGHQYVVAADTAEGVGKDHNALVVVDMTPSLRRPKVVATYKNNKIAPDELAFEIYFAGEKYYFPLCAVERNNTGHATITALKRIYPEEKLYRMEKDDKYETEETERIGWVTNLATKPKMFYDLKTIVNLEGIDIDDESLLHELDVYDRKLLSSAKFDEKATNHFDLVTALAIAYQMRHKVEDMSSDVSVHSPYKETRNNIHSAI